MPAKNTVKPYIVNTYYHIYNRGVNKRLIFKEDRDYKIFLSYLSFYLTLPGQTRKSYASKPINNFANQIDLLAYCLMPNHFHLLIFQKDKDSINFFMRSLIRKYVQAFNTHYHRIGPLFQGRYKAVLMDSEQQLLYTSKYIHLNPNPERTSGSDPEVYPYSSYKNYLGIIHQNWVKPQEILNHFSDSNPLLTYQAYVDDISADTNTSETVPEVDS